MRWCGGNLPAGLRRAGHGRRIDPQQEQRHARLPRRQDQPAAGRQVQFAQRPPDLDHQGPQGRAAQRIDSAAQQGQPIGDQPHHDALRPQAQCAQPASLKHAARADCAVGAQPQYGLVRSGLIPRHSGSENRDKAGRRRAVLGLDGIDLVHAAIGQAAAQHAVQCRHPAGPAALGHWLGHGCSRRRSGGEGRIDSHMFLLCSNSASRSHSISPAPTSRAGRRATPALPGPSTGSGGHYNVDRNYTANGLNQYTAAGSASFGYDANGNLTADGSTSFTYDAENRLVSASPRGTSGNSSPRNAAR